MDNLYFNNYYINEKIVYRFLKDSSFINYLCLKSKTTLNNLLNKKKDIYHNKIINDWDWINKKSYILAISNININYFFNNKHFYYLFLNLDNNLKKYIFRFL